MKIANGRSHFYQWELDQKLIVEENCTAVHYYNGSRKKATVCEVRELDGVRVADVPNDLLQTAADLHAYAWNDFAGCVVAHRVFGVQPKARPDDYAYTPTEVKSYDSLVAQFEKHGAYYLPSVAENGDLTWKASASGLPDVAGGNIRGPQGPPGGIGRAYIGEDGALVVVDMNANAFINEEGALCVVNR